MVKKVFLILGIVLLLIQFFRPVKNISRGENPNSIDKKYPVPAEVSQVLSKACYDCHSNTTRYPWYAEIQPSAWILANHIKDGKSELNFDEFSQYTSKKQHHKMEEVKEMMEKSEMPLASYELLHKTARLTEQEKQILIGWAAGLMKEIKP